MTRILSPRVGFFLVALGLCGSRSAFAAGEDTAALSTVQTVLNEDYANANFGEARRKLVDALAKCNRGCTGSAVAQIETALGMVMFKAGRIDEARQRFDAALQASPQTALPQRATPEMRTEWAEAKKRADSPKGDSDPAPAGKLAGWANPDAFKEASAGLAADMAGKLDGCILHDKKSVELEEQPRTRLHLASCEARAGKLLDALRDAQKALEVGIKRGDQGVMRAARERITRIIPRIPHVTFAPPSGVSDLQVTFDDRPVPADALTKKFSIDPGKHSVRAEGTQGGIPLVFEHEYAVQEGDLLTVTIAFRASSPEYLTQPQLRCMVSAKTQEDVLRCLPSNKKNLAAKAGFSMASYTDTNHVTVTSPELNATVFSPTAGWSVGGNLVVDVYSAASPDIVAMASPRYHEKRYAGGLNGGYKPGKFGASAFGNVSSEPDYVSLTGGGALTAELNDKLIVPKVGYSYSHDTIGRSGTSFDRFSHSFNTHEVEGAITFVVSPTTLFLVGGTVKFERGDQSKPYRYVPMFDRLNVAPFVPAGATVNLVNEVRLPIKVLEQLPTERDRYALAFRLIKRIGSSATLRVDERLYYDTWETKATTTDMRYAVDLSRYFRVWPHARFHWQTDANFYRRAYAPGVDPQGFLIVPTYRTTDRELSPMITLTGGGGTRIALTSPDAGVQLGLTLQADLMYSRYFDALYITQRTAVYGSLGIDAEFD